MEYYMFEINNIVTLSKLIAKNISNQLSQSDRDQLYLWRTKSLKNEELFLKINNHINFNKRNIDYKNIDTQNAWTQLSFKIDKSKKRSYSKIYKCVASILLPLIIAIGLYKYYNNWQAFKLDNIANTILTSTETVSVIMSNGKIVELEKSKIAEIDENGIVAINKNGELSYHLQQTKHTKNEIHNTLVVPKGCEYCVTLSDGSQIQMNSFSKLTYPVEFNSDRREVFLEGEAYFNIKKDNVKPFIVNVNKMQIEVLGTSFNIKAYTDENELSTTLVEGKIKLKSNTEEFTLTPNQQATLRIDDNDIEIKEVDVNKFISWKSGVYCFTNQSLEDILKNLSRWYDFKYEFSDENLKDVRLEGGINKYQDINTALDIMKSTGKFDFTINEKTITLKPN